MKKQILAICAISGASLLAINARNDDPVLMNIAGKDVHLSEFEYLYNKNNTQQVQPQTTDEYIDMFVNFKLKVAEAEAEGLDTTMAFETEYIKFRNELAAPYLRDKAVEDSLLRQAYSHTLEDVTVSHIMLPSAQKHLADSLREAIISGQAEYEDVARNNSIDRPSAQRGGLMGLVQPGRYPWAFEEMAYNTPEGQISEVVNSGMGLHIIRVESRRPAKGQVHASHILRMTRGMDDSTIQAQKVTIDSIYNAVKGGASFASLASTYSQDPGSAQRGGDLGWFGPGMMVHEFDSVAFAIADGEISEPFRTSFGYHIINRLESKKPGTFEESLDNLRAMLDRDPARSEMPARAYAQNLIREYKGQISPKGLEAVRKLAQQSGGVIDSTFMAGMLASKAPAFTLRGKATTLAELAPYIPSVSPDGVDAVVEFVKTSAQDLMEAKAVDIAREELALTNPEYRNLINEYRDGILLFEVSDRNVWKRASSDTEGLENYFRTHRDKYATWEQPKYKSYVIFAQTDSALNAVMTYAQDSIPASVTGIDVVTQLRDRFGRDIKVERVIAAKGENAITDFLGFGAEKPAVDPNTKWKFYSAFRGKVIEQPEEAADVRGAVVPDYQNELETTWIETLRNKYPVKINRKVLKK